MSTLLSEPRTVPAPPLEPQHEAAVRTQVWTVLSALYPRDRHIERRRSHRYPYPHLIRLTPVAADGTPTAEGRIAVVGKNLSETGLSFYHLGPLALRRAIASLETLDGRWTSFLIDLTWCRFTQHGWYESGGFFKQSVPTPPGLNR